MQEKLKKFAKKIKKSFLFYYFILIMIILLPNAITMPSLSFKNAIITAIGLDRSEESDIEVTVLALSNITQDNMAENTKVFSGKATSVANAINSIEQQIGRRILMGHVGYVVVSKDLATEDIAGLLNNLIITTKLPNTVSMVLCEDMAKDVLTLASKMEQSSSYKLKEIIQNEFNENYTKDTSVDAFLKGYYSNLSTSTLEYLKLTNTPSDGIEVKEEGEDKQSNSQNSSSGGSQESSKQQKNTISLQREHAVFVDGKFKFLLSKEEMKGINWLVESSLQQLLTIENIKSQGFENANITFDVRHKSVKPKATFRNNKPTIEFNITLNISPIEVLQKGEHERSPKDFYINEEIYDKINYVIKKQISVTINKLRQEKTDVINAYGILYNSHYQKTKDFENSLEDKEDFLSYINFKVNIIPRLVDN